MVPSNKETNVYVIVFLHHTNKNDVYASVCYSYFTWNKINECPCRWEFLTPTHPCIYGRWLRWVDRPSLRAILEISEWWYCHQIIDVLEISEWIFWVIYLPMDKQVCYDSFLQQCSVRLSLMVQYASSLLLINQSDGNSWLAYKTFNFGLIFSMLNVFLFVNFGYSYYQDFWNVKCTHKQ